DTTNDPNAPGGANFRTDRRGPGAALPPMGSTGQPVAMGNDPAQPQPGYPPPQYTQGSQYPQFPQQPYPQQPGQPVPGQPVPGQAQYPGRPGPGQQPNQSAPTVPQRIRDQILGQAPSASAFNNPPPGNAMGAGIAGIGMPAEYKGEGIITVKERSKYREWEFI